MLFRSNNNNNNNNNGNNLQYLVGWKGEGDGRERVSGWFTQEEAVALATRVSSLRVVRSGGLGTYLTMVAGAFKLPDGTVAIMTSEEARNAPAGTRVWSGGSFRPYPRSMFAV